MKLIKTCFTALSLTLMSTIAYAEHTAPVYDVDSMSNESQSAGGISQQDNDNSAKAALNQALTASEPPASVEQRIARLEQQLENAQQNDSANRLNSMQGELQALRGQVEELTHQLQELRNAQRMQQPEADKTPAKDLSEQAMSPVPRDGDEDTASLTKYPHAKDVLKSGAAAQHPAPAKLASLNQPAKKGSLTDKSAAAAEQPNLAQEQAVYQSAYNLIKVKKYNDAIETLKKMLVKYPSGQFAANAHYWLGELYSLTGENEQAASEFDVVVKSYPNNPRVADAELKLGLINATLLKWPVAKAYFKQVLSKYPGTTSARLAMEQLKLLKQAGH